MAGTSPAMTVAGERAQRPLLGRLLDLGRERLGAGPAVLGDVEQDALGAEEFFLKIAGLVAALALVDVVPGAKAFELFREFVDILDQHPEMVDAAIVHPLAELVGL